MPWSFRDGPKDQTRNLEILRCARAHDDTATALKQRAAERGVSVPELVAELVTLDARPIVVDSDDIAELDRRWKSFEGKPR